MTSPPSPYKKQWQNPYEQLARVTLPQTMCLLSITLPVLFSFNFLLPLPLQAAALIIRHTLWSFSLFSLLTLQACLTVPQLKKAWVLTSKPTPILLCLYVFVERANTGVKGHGANCIF